MHSCHFFAFCCSIRQGYFLKLREKKKINVLSYKDPLFFTGVFFEDLCSLETINFLHIPCLESIKQESSSHCPLNSSKKEKSSWEFGRVPPVCVSQRGWDGGCECRWLKSRAKLRTPCDSSLVRWGWFQSLLGQSSRGGRPVCSNKISPGRAD